MIPNARGILLSFAKAKETLLDGDSWAFGLVSPFFLKVFVFGVSEAIFGLTVNLKLKEDGRNIQISLLEFYKMIKTNCKDLTKMYLK